MDYSCHTPISIEGDYIILIGGVDRSRILRSIGSGERDGVPFERPSPQYLQVSFQKPELPLG